MKTKNIDINSIYAQMGDNASLLLAYRGNDPLKLMAKAAAAEAVAFEEERLNYSLEEFANDGDLDIFLFEVGVTLRSTSAELLKCFAGREGAKELLRRRAHLRHERRYNQITPTWGKDLCPEEDEWCYCSKWSMVS